MVLKSVNVQETETTKKNMKFVQNYIVISGIYLIIFIWLKDENFINNLSKIYKVITIIIITRVIAVLVKPEGIVSKVLNRQENRK